MAGDWIKFEHASLSKPEILRSAELLGVPVDQAIGIYIRFWVWLDANLSGFCPDCVRSMSRKSLDAMMNCPGFSSVLEQVGWAKFDDERSILTLSNADRHNGSPAKSRALDAKRKREKRLDSVREMSGSKPDVDRTREEKRREYIKSNAMSNSQKTANLDVTPLPRNNDNRERRTAATEILGFLNAKTSRNFRMQDQNIGPIMARMKDGATPRELRAVIVRKCREWGSDDKMAKYLRPATLFNATKFAQYVGEVPPESEVQDAQTLP